MRTIISQSVVLPAPAESLWCVRVDLAPNRLIFAK